MYYSGIWNYNMKIFPYQCILRSFENINSYLTIGMVHHGIHRVTKN